MVNDEGGKYKIISSKQRMEKLSLEKFINHTFNFM